MDGVKTIKLISIEIKKMERQRENSPQIPYSFPMANGTHKRNPYPGVSLFCVGSTTQCRDTLPPNPQEKKLPVLYGTTVAPSGFVGHNTEDCPVPRISTFESLEEFWAQDFLQTFMDCIKDSDFTTSSAQDFGVDNAYIFNDSTRQSVNTDTYNNSFPYQCCLYPSFYQAAVRGQQQLTLYFNPLFSSQYDYNCHLEDDCLGHGSVNITSNSSNTDLKKATPHSSHWYLLNSLALLETQSTQVQFWKNHEVGTTHTRDEVSQQLFSTNYGLLGDPALEEAAQNVIGSHYTAAKVYNSDPLLKLPQHRLHDVATMFCPEHQQFNHLARGAIDRYHAGIKSPYHNYISYPYTAADVNTQQNNQQIPSEKFNRNFFDAPIPWSTLSTTQAADEPNFKLQTKLACCVRDLPLSESLYFNTMSKFFTPPVTNGVNGPPYITQLFSTSRYMSILGACESFLCPTSPICHNLLLNYCSNSLESHSSQYCRRWHSWANANYGPKTANYQNSAPRNFVSWTSAELPWGAHHVGVDMSNRSLLSACSESLRLGNTTSSLYKDMCQGLFSTTYQTNFPRLHTFEWGDAIQYQTELLFPYTLSHLESQVNISAVYARYEYYTKYDIWPGIYRFQGGGAKGFLARFLWGQNQNWSNQGTYPNLAYGIMPTKREDLLATIFAVDPNSTIRTETLSEFIDTFRNGFNTALINMNGNFVFPPPTLPTFTQTLTSKLSKAETSKVDQTITISPFNPNHGKDTISWVTNSFIVTHSSDATQLVQRLRATDINRLEDPNFLYSSQTNLQLFGGPTNRALVPGFEGQAVPGNVTYTRPNFTQGVKSYIPPNVMVLATETTMYNSMLDLYNYGNGNFSWTMCGTDPCYPGSFPFGYFDFPNNFPLSQWLGIAGIFPYTLPPANPPSYVPSSFPNAASNDINQNTMVGAEGVLGYNAPFFRTKFGSQITSSLDTDVFYPSIKISFTEKATFMLGLPSPDIIIPMPISSVDPATITVQSFQSTTSFPGQVPFNVRNRALFYITNTSNITFSNVSVLNNFSDYFSVSLNTLSLSPGDRALVNVKMLNINTITNPPTSLSLYPILFFDSVSWQPSLTSQDFPILGGFYACQTFDDALIQNDFVGNRFSEYVVDPNLANPTDPSYLSNQSIYPRGSAPIGARNLTIVPLV
jgi:hypothetical protein